jgi:hypothetical protein
MFRIVRTCVVTAHSQRSTRSSLGQAFDDSGNGQPGDTSAPDSGAVRVLARTGSAWSQAAYLKAALPRAGANATDTGVGADAALASGTVWFFR